MITPTFRTVRLWLVSALVVCAPVATGALIYQQESEEEKAVQIQYLEIVTSDVDATCGALEKLHGVRFGKPEAALGNARTAALAGGGMIGVRAPLHDAEEPVVRPYLLVDDIDVAAAEAGGEIAHPPMEIPGHGKFAIYIQGGLHHGLWQV